MCLPLVHTSLVGGKFKEGLQVVTPPLRRGGWEEMFLRVSEKMAANISPNVLPLVHTSLVGGKFKEGLHFFTPPL